MGLVDQGHVTEALAEADREPQLLETVGLLEFPEREDWVALLSRLGLDAPPELRLDLAERLDEAYATNQGLEGLLRKHRLLALTRSSLASRIAILRLICERDDQNLVWKQDLAGLERARLKQIELELSEQVRKRSFADVNAIHQELTGAAWAVPIPQELVRRTTDAMSQLVEGNRRAVAERAGAELREAFLGYDETRGAAALAAWRVAVAPLSLQPADPLMVDHRDAIAWAEEIEAERLRHSSFERALASLVEVMDRGGDLTALDRAEYRVRKLELPLPPVTGERVRAYRQQLEFRRKVRLVGAAVAIVLVSGALIALVWVVVDRMRIGNEALEVAGRLDQLLATNEIAAAESLVASLDAAVVAHNSVAPRVGKLEALVAAERDRVDQRRTAIEAVKNAGWDTPDLASLENSRSLSRSENELAEVSNLELSIERRQNELKGERESEYRRRFEAFEMQVRQAEQDGTVEGAEQQLVRLRESIEGLRRETAGMVNGIEFVSESERRRIDPLLKSIDASLERIATRRQLMAVADEVTLGVGDIDRFARSLEQLRSATGSSSLGSELGIALAERPLWEGYATWQRLLSEPRWRSYPAWTDAEEASFSAEAGKLLSQAPIVGIRERIEAIIAHRKNAGRSAMIDPGRRFERQAFVGVTLYRDARGRLYHAIAAPTRRGGDLELQYYLDEDYLVGRERVPETKLEELGPAPQCRLFVQLQPILEALGRREMPADVALLRLIEQVHAFSETAGEEASGVGLDPLLRARLLRNLLAEARALDPDLVYRHLSGYDDKIKPLGGSVDENWLAPIDADAEQARRDAAEAITGLPPLEKIRTSISVVESEAIPPPWPTSEYRWVGWIWRDANGTHAVRHRSPLEDGPIYCLAGQATGTPQAAASFEPIGNVERQLTRLDGPAGIAGRPVYQRIARPDP